VRADEGLKTTQSSPLWRMRDRAASMGNALPRNDYLRLLYEQAAQEQRQLPERVKAAQATAH